MSLNSGTYNKTNRIWKDELSGQYVDAMKAQYPWLGAVAQFIPSDKKDEYFHQWLDNGYLALYTPGDKRKETVFDDRELVITNKDYSKVISWQINEEKDDLSPRKMVDVARQAGQEIAQLHARAFYRMILESADTETLDTIPTCADGNGLFSASHADATGGNIVSVTDPTTTSLVQAAYKAVRARALKFQLPSYVANSLDGGYYYTDADLDAAQKHVFFNPDYEQVYYDYFKNQLMIQTAGTAGTDLAAASIGNEFAKSTGRSVYLHPTPAITTGDAMYFFDLPGRPKPIFILEREVMSTQDQDENSDQGFWYRQKSTGIYCRYGFGYGNHLGAIKADVT